MIQRDSPFVLNQALATMGRSTLLSRLHARGHADVGMPDVKLLWCLGDQPVNVKQVAAMTGTTKQFAARTVAKLRDCGLIDVASQPDDKRALAITVTRNGSRLVAVIAEVKQEIEREWRKVLGGPAFDAMTVALARLAASLDQ